MQRIKIPPRSSEKPAPQRRSSNMTAPHVRQSPPAAAELIATSVVWQLEQRSITASQEIVVTTTTLTLWISDRVRKFHRGRHGFSLIVKWPARRVFWIPTLVVACTHSTGNRPETVEVEHPAAEGKSLVDARRHRTFGLAARARARSSTDQ
jgi:hypothetical protein